eukprot:TRINITY_DN2342_c0_g1_i5.p2 TRINITY_DN2342_c0_g1~~TRINITY_DN2342_c0_g1_i5.p2  ORF type:complete len:314 (-),score=77.31 TRINITY_DN2342_c0_g1_i5:2182-3123(-)
MAMNSFKSLFCLIFILFLIQIASSQNCTQNTDCSSCASHINCVWCSISTEFRSNNVTFGCVQGNPIGAKATEFCQDFWWIQCNFSGNRFGTSYTYVIIMIIIFTVLVFLITVIILLSIRFCKCRREKKETNDFELKLSPSQTSKKSKDGSQKDFYDSQKAQKLEEILNQSAFVTPVSHSPLQSSPPSANSVPKELARRDSEVQVSIPIQLYSVPPTIRHPDPEEEDYTPNTSKPSSPKQSSPPAAREEEDVVIPPMNYRLTALISPEAPPRYSQIREPQDDIFAAMREQDQNQDFKRLDSQFDDIQRALNELE